MPFMITTLYAQVPTIHALSDVESYHMISVGVLICEAVLNRRGTQQNTAIRWGVTDPREIGDSDLAQHGWG